ncbi:MAG TPA: hypothetical protein VML55_19200 [Planctomycetaceae bacterium]|nr:hypothetical protein [Planctomycetaceae bacterium]
MTTSSHIAECELGPADDLGFEAFRYVAGEMADAESAAFEQRLAADQQAREAVARAVEIAQAVTVLGPQAVAAAGPAFASVRRPSRRAALVMLVATVAACLLLAVALDPFGRSGRDPVGDGLLADSGRPANAARLVEFWTDADDLLARSEDTSALEGYGASWIDEPGTAGENGADSDFAWMLAAVSAEMPTPDNELPPEPGQEN